MICHALQELDTQEPQHVDFWDALRLIADLELAEAIKQDKLDWARLRNESIPAEYRSQRAGMHQAVDKDIQHMLAGMDAAPSCCFVMQLHTYTFATYRRVRVDQHSQSAGFVCVTLWNRCPSLYPGCQSFDGPAFIDCLMRQL